MVTVKSNIQVTRTSHSRLSEVDFNNIPFGRIFADHMLVADYNEGKWSEPKIVPYGKIEVAPCITSLHYGQAIFEGMKAQRNENGEALLFRPLDNHQRLNFSADRMCMPSIPEELFMEGLLELIRLDKEWIPTTPGAALYIRPFMFATDEYVGIKASESYKFMIFSSPVGPYYPEPVKLMVNTKYVRAAKGGTGEAKSAGNYGASLKGAQEARAMGYHNVMWLDAHEQKFVEECGTMNVFFIIDGVAVTPNLTGTILRGITRHSVIKLLKDMGIKVQERQISIDEVTEAFHAGKLEEIFGTGTAATVAHVSHLWHDGEEMVLPSIENRSIGPVVLEQITNIRTGQVPDPYGWVVKV